MPKPTSHADDTAIRVVIVTLDSHLAGAADLARAALGRELPGLGLELYSASEWCGNPAELEACRSAIGRADIVIVNMLFMEDHVEAVRDALEARRDHCDAMICILAAPEVARLTRMGALDMSKSDGGGLALLKKLRGKSATDKNKPASAGARQMAVLRRLPQILRFIPGTAQDLRAYFLTMRYWLLGSQANIANMVRLLIGRYAAGPRQSLRERCRADAPVEYPEVGIYHPDLPGRIGTAPADVPALAEQRGRVGLIVMRSYVLAGNTAHYDGVIEALAARGLQALPVFASGLDAREAVDAYFRGDGGSGAAVDAVISLTGFSLVGGPAYNDAAAARAVLGELDVPYLSAQALEFQTLDDWQAREQGLLPLETTMMVAIPELDGATGAMVYGGRGGDGADGRRMRAHPERAATLAARVESLVRLRRAERRERRVAVVLFDFPPNSGSTGSAAHLAVFASLFNTLQRLAAEGYDVAVPESVDALRDALLEGNRHRYGTAANVHARVATEDHVRRETHLAEIEDHWGPAPGRVQTDGSGLLVLGAQFGNVFVGVQPGFGYEGDPMRLLFERGFAPTHAFAAFYRYLKDDFAADAVLHFGTHGALEFMPGKQAGMSGECWPDRLIGALPNFYLYAANNPSEGTIAKRRSQATTITYLTPPVAAAGLYRGLDELKASVERFRTGAEGSAERQRLASLIQTQAAALDLAVEAPAWSDAEAAVSELRGRLLELEETLIPCGLHVVGEAPDAADRRSLIAAMADARGLTLDAGELELLATGELDAAPRRRAEPEALGELRRAAALLRRDSELDAIIHALDGGYLAPVSGGDLLRNPDILPTGRNLHGFDPMRLPSRFAVVEGRRQAEALLARHGRDGAALPQTLAMVLWGTDNLKTEGVAIGQALALIGATPRMDSYGRLAGADLISLEDLGRARVDVVITLSGIFRDLLPNQTRLLADAARQAALADEPLEQNPIRRHALAWQQAHGGSLEEAALRVFSNADGAYGANVNMLVDNGVWQDESELGEMFTRRKCFAYGVESTPAPRPELLADILGHVELTYQNLDSLELGVTTVDHYFDSLGGISRAVHEARGEGVPTFIGDHTQGVGTVRSLADQVDLETRTRVLNPRWYEDMLEHGYEGVHQIEVHITNTMGWSATTGQVAPWVYREISNTFVLDETMRNRLAELNPTASMRLANRLLEATERAYWQPEPGVLDALQRAGEALEDKLEGITEGAVA